MKKRGLVALVALLLGILLLAQASETISMYGQQFDKNAKQIDLGKHKVTDVAELTNFLSQFTALEKVDMYESRLKHQDFADLTAKFPNIRFGWTIRFFEHTIRTDATGFSTLHTRKAPWHSTKDFDVLKYCPDLEALDLGHNMIDDISFLRNFPKLKILILAANHIKDITPLADLKQLEYAELFKNKIEDISPLQGLENLLDLNICFNYVKDYSPLYDMASKDKLERLWVYNSNNYMASDPLPQEIVNKIKAALPKTYVDSTSYSTLGGWRRHPRYYVIFDVFKHGAYKPWDAKMPNGL